MALTLFPNELLDIIVRLSIPTGLEGVALSCKRLYSVCQPFFLQHNRLRHQFRNFRYGFDHPVYISTAADLITYITANPIAAEYIQIADLGDDGRQSSPSLEGSEQRIELPSIDEGGALVQLFAESEVLREAQQEWKEYYERFKDEAARRRYSQVAAQFLLTLLPNVEVLRLPKAWNPTITTTKILNVMINKAAVSSPSRPAALSSLRRVEGIYNVELMSSFMALPSLQTYQGPIPRNFPESLSAVAPPIHFYYPSNLRSIHLIECSMDAARISKILRCTPHLRTLKYAHCTIARNHRDPVQTWDLCGFVNAVDFVAGSNLVEFSVTIDDLHGYIASGKASLRGFKRLEKLEIPLELVLCNVRSAGVLDHVITSMQRLLYIPADSFVDDIIPPTVRKLSVTFHGKREPEKGLQALFHRFPPALQELHIACPGNASDAYKQECDRIVKKAEGKSLVVRLQSSKSSYRFRWEGEGEGEGEDEDE